MTETFELSNAMKSAMFSMASMVNVTSDNYLETEEQCLDLLNEVTNKIERLIHESSNRSTENSPNMKKDKFNEEKVLSKKAKTLEDELRVSLQSIDNLNLLKSKSETLLKKVNKEKQQRQVLEKFIESQNKKISLLVTHIEKLMKTLKIESNKYMRSLEINRQLKTEEANLHSKLNKQAKIIATQNRCIQEIEEGSKVLEDQLKLMDEKFMELRKKFEQSKSLFSSHLTKALKESNELRVKYTMSVCGGTGGMLDSIDPTTNSKHNNMNNRAKSASSKSNNHRHVAYDTDKSNMKSQDNCMYNVQQQSPNIVKYSEQFVNNISSKSHQQLYFLQQSTDKESETPYNTYTPKSNQGFSNQQQQKSHLSQSNMNITRTIKVPDESHILKKIASKTKNKNWSREELEDLMNK